MTDVLVVGRDEANDLSLPEDFSASRLHARFKRDRAVFQVEDLGSRNGTFVERDGKRHRVSSAMLLQAGDIICIAYGFASGCWQRLAGHWILPQVTVPMQHQRQALAV